MRKILILGANNSQIQLIHAAKAEGYYIIACDYTNNNPGLPLVDKHYQISYLDKDAVLDIAKTEHIDGIIGNTDPAMPIVAYISQQLGLVGNAPESINKLCSKNEFRDIQDKNGLYCPKHCESGDCPKAKTEIERFAYPIIVKPSESAGSQGTTKIYNNQTERFCEAFQTCKELSRNGKVTVEEYVEMPSLEMIEGDIFVMGDDILWNGLFTTRRSIMSSMIPMTYIFPAIISQDELSIIKSKISNLIKEIGIRHGEYNIEMYFTSSGELFIIEINPRQGGHRITQLIQLHSGYDYNKLLVTTAVGDNEYFEKIKNSIPENNYNTLHVVFSNFSGTLERIECHPNIQKYIQDIEIHKKEGTMVSQRRNATDYIAYVTMQFPNRESQLSYSREQTEQMIYPIVCDKKVPISDCTLPYQPIYDFMTGDAYNFFVPKLSKVSRSPEDYAKQLSDYCTIAYYLNEQNQLTGMVAGYTHNLRIKDWSYIAEVYVNSDQRGKGLGKELLTAYIDYCKLTHMKGVWLHVKDDNIPAQHLYKKLGFLFDESYNENGYLKMELSF